MSRNLLHDAAMCLSLSLLGACADKAGDSGEASDLFTLVAPGLAGVDTSPDPDAAFIYAVGQGDEGGAIWRVDAEGGEVETLLSGDLLVAPVGLAVGDGVVYVADEGGVLAVSTSTGEASAFGPGWSPAGLDLRADGGLVAVGTSEAGAPVVATLSAEGALTEVDAGGLLERPSGVAVAPDGALYVSMGEDLSSGSILKIDAEGVASVFASGLGLGEPAGLALTLDGGTLLVSGLVDGSDQVYAFDTSTREHSTITDGIAQNQQAGGVHRALRVNVFSWADRAAGVYRVNP